MPTYNYKGRDGAGNLVDGSVDAANENAVAETLLSRGVRPVEIKIGESANKKGGFDLSSIFSRKISQNDLLMFCRQMYTLSKAGIPIMRALHGLGDTISNKKLVEVLKQLESDLAGGLPLAVAMKKFPKVFNSLFVALVNVGENTGRLEEAFQQLAEYISLEVETKRRVKSAMRYPVIVISFIVLAMIILNIWVIPVFADMFGKFGVELPLSTRILIGTSNFFVKYVWFIFALLFLLPFAWLWWIKTPAGRYKWGKWQLKIPVMGSILIRSQLARFSRSFAIMIRSGVSLNVALTLVADAIDNAYLAEKVLKMREGVERGESMYQTAVASGMFSPLVLQMFAVGDETGQIDTLLIEVAEHYDREVDYELKALTSKIEPILLLVVAGMVLILALGIFTPMWDMYGAMQGKHK
ncbi:MAG: type II secretion system F family protein [Succinivibrionaceae bacterium]|nr:type II secretion system F family protein [Succinivibrionaceae bacterium]